MIKRGLLWMLAVALALGVGVGVVVFTQEQQVPQIPGITATDEHPKGCVNCHKERPDIGQDFRLSTKIHEWAYGGRP